MQTLATDRFIVALGFGGFLSTPAQLAELTKLERECPVYFRLYEARFTCWVQYAQTMVEACSKAELTLRDICVCAPRLELARQRVDAADAADAADLRANYAPAFNEADCGGVFDGNQVTSDADPGL